MSRAKMLKLVVHTSSRQFDFCLHVYCYATLSAKPLSGVYLCLLNRPQRLQCGNVMCRTRGCTAAKDSEMFSIADIHLTAVRLMTMQSE